MKNVLTFTGLILFLIVDAIYGWYRHRSLAKLRGMRGMRA